MRIQKNASIRVVRSPALAALPLALAAVLGCWHSSTQATEIWQTTTPAAISKVASSANDGTTGPSRNKTQWSAKVDGKLQLLGAGEVTPLEASKQLDIAVTLPMLHRDQFNKALADLHDPKSAAYRKFLTPVEFKSAYGPSEQDVQKVVDHLKKSGFTHISVSGANQLVSAQGNALNVSAAFNTSMKQFTVDGKEFYGNDSGAQVPSSLSGIVNGVLGLENLSVRHTYNHPVALANNADGMHVSHSPTAFQKIYHVGDTPTAYATTVAVIGWGGQEQTQTDLNQFIAANSLDPVALDVVKIPVDGDFSDDSDEVEWALDTQTIVGMSGGVKKLMFYTAPSGNLAEVFAAETKAVDDNIAKLINCSYGSPEVDPANPDFNAPQIVLQQEEEDLFARAELQGQIFSVASGDHGSYEENKGIVDPSSKTYQDDLKKYSVGWPAASAHVVSVGGTTLYTDPADSTAWAREVVWNDGSVGGSQLVAGGGGISNHIAAPAWQGNHIGAAADVHRVIPDVSFNANSAITIVDGRPIKVEGTSLASPIFVGAFARIETAANNSIGLPNGDMYLDFSDPKNAAVLHDVISGNNGIDGGQAVVDYQAGPGFDRATGWGSFDVDKLRVLAVARWGNGSAPPAPPAAKPVAAVVPENGVSVQMSGKPDASNQFTVQVPAGAKALNLRTFGGSGDVALYVKFGAAASATSFDFVSKHADTNSESITIGAPKIGTYYVTVTGPVTYANVNISARYVPAKP